MAFSCIFFMRDLMLFFGIFSLVSFSMVCSWIAPLTPVVMVDNWIMGEGKKTLKSLHISHCNCGNHSPLYNCPSNSVAVSSF